MVGALLAVGSGGDLQQFTVGLASPQPLATANRDVESRVRKLVTLEDSNHLHDRDRYEAVGIDLFQATENIRAAHAGIDQYDHDAGSHQAEREGDELETGANHQHQALAGLHTPSEKAVGDGGRFPFELRKRPSPVAVLARRVTSVRLHHRNLIGPARGRGGQAIRDVERLRHSGRSVATPALIRSLCG